MAIQLAFCNDCDFQSWENYKVVHHELATRNILAGDSFWLFDPSGGDFGLFRRNCSEKGPKHEELLEEIRKGRIDVLHSAGSYSAPFSQGLRPDRNLIGEALEYLRKHARVPRIWTNHGDENNIQNVGGEVPAHYHRGDLPGSECYVLDLLIEHGVEYFWVDRQLTMNASQPMRLVASEATRSGHDIKIFSRFMGTAPYAPNGQNLGLQLNDANLEQWLANSQNVIIYQHWACHHTPEAKAYMPTGAPLTPESLAALSWLEQRQAEGKIEVVRLSDLLDREDKKASIEEVDRIARVCSRSQASAADIHYYTQFHKHTVGYFNSRMDHLSPGGHRALDAGCGVGQWSLCLSERFDQIEGFDSSAEAIAIAKNISDAARLEINFSVRDIYSNGYPDNHFDFSICYGVIFLVEALKALKEIYRVMKPGSSCIFSVNGDGWYQYLVEERLENRGDAERQLYVESLWNSYVARCGGLARLRTIGGALKSKLVEAYDRNDAQTMARLLSEMAMSSSKDLVDKTLQRFSEYIVRGLSKRAINSIVEPSRWNRARNHLAGMLSSLSDQRTEKADLRAIPLFNRPYIPEEFEQVLSAAGFVDFRWGRDASLSFDPRKPESTIKPLHDLYFKENLRVWECLASKPKLTAPNR